MKPCGNSVQRIFSIDLPANEWIQFKADGFYKSACGVIYRPIRPPTSGMPLGAIDTGCIELKANGTFGYCTIFNSTFPRRQLDLPFLGLSVGGNAWLLATDTKDQLWGHYGTTGISYWGHYPMADLEYDTGSRAKMNPPVTVGLRAWAPFLPGDVENSLIPGIVFEIRVRNVSNTQQQVTLAISFPGPTKEEAEEAIAYPRRSVEGAFSGISITNGGDIGYCLGVAGKEKVRIGGKLGIKKEAWANIERELPSDAEDEPGTSVAVDFSIPEGGVKTVRFILSWCNPRWKSGGHPGGEGNTFTHMYTTHYPTALAAAQHLAENHETLLKRILAWQQVIYTEENLPVWLRESLVNVLHLIAVDGVWAVAKHPLPDWVRNEDGLFGMNEFPSAGGQIECIPCSFYGNMPLVYFFPQLALSTLRGYKGYQYPDGAPPWVFGRGNDMATPTKGYQLELNGSCYVDMVDRYWLRTGDYEVLKEFYESVKKTTMWTMNLNPGPTGIISVLKSETGWGHDWFEHCELFGMTPHVGGIHLAHLRMAERMAEKVGDENFAKQCREWIEEGSDSMENKMWSGSYYLNYYESETGKKSDLIFGYQLDGEWMTRFHGLPSIFRPDRIKTTLSTIKRFNATLTKYGAVNFTNPDGTPANEVGYGTYSMFPPEVIMLGSNYIYEGERDFGLELARRHWHNIVCEKGYTWDQPNILRGDADTGDRLYGSDYYQNMMLWALPAALEGKDLHGPVLPGGLVNRILHASQSLQ